MAKPKFVYVTYIATTPEKVWEALTNPDFTQKFWSGVRQESEWKVGSPWCLKMPNGEVWDSGEVLEFDPPNRYVVSWRHEHFEDLRAIGFTRMAFDLEVVGIDPASKIVKVTVTHEAPEGGEAFLDAVSQGWPGILSSLKSLLETGKPLAQIAPMPD